MKSKMAPPDSPGHLTEDASGFWKRTQADYAITDEAGLRLLTLASECLDLAETCRLAIAKDGPVYADRFGAPRPRPEAAMGRNAMLTFARLTRELGLEPKT